jgi:hypothetical protein
LINGGKFLNITVSYFLSQSPYVSQKGEQGRERERRRKKKKEEEIEQKEE